MFHVYVNIRDQVVFREYGIYLFTIFLFSHKLIIAISILDGHMSCFAGGVETGNYHIHYFIIVLMCGEW